MKELKIKINVYHKVNVDIEGLENHINDRICNPIPPSSIKSITIDNSERYINTMQKIYNELENK